MPEPTFDRDTLIHHPEASSAAERHAALERFAQAVAAIVAQDRLPPLPDDASEVDLYEAATRLTSQR